MADLSQAHGGDYEDCDEGVFEQGDGSPPSSHVEDDSLPPLLRIQKYAQSENLHDRQMVWRILTDLFGAGQPEAMTTYLPLIMNIVAKLVDEGDNSVRKELLEQVPNVAAAAKECAARIPALASVPSEYLLPMVVRNVGTEESIVRRAAQTALFALMERDLVTRRDVEVKVCPTVLALSRDTVADYHISAITGCEMIPAHITASFDERNVTDGTETSSEDTRSILFLRELMSKLAPMLGKEVTERIFLDRFSQLCNNKTFYVRKVCASHFGEFCSVVGKTAYEQVLLPSFISLCEDDVWGVRKACADVAMSVSCACPPAIRRAALAPVFIKLLQDNNRWVRMSAFQILGPFISTFANPASYNLFCNNVGELILVNTDGREFRVKSTSQHRLFPTQDNFREDDVNYDFIERKVQILKGLLGEPEEPEPPESEDQDNQENVNDVTVDIPVFDDEINASTTSTTVAHANDVDRKWEDVILQKSLNVISKIFGDEEAASAAEDVDVKTEGEVSGAKEDSEDIKEIVETVKNAVLSFRNEDGKDSETADDCEDEVTSRGANSLKTDFEEDSGMGTESTTTKVSSSEGNSDERGTEANAIEEKTNVLIATTSETSEEKRNVQNTDDLNQFNSYNYWYISPDANVDLSVLEEQSSSNSSNNVQTEHICSLVSSIGFDESYSETSINDKTYLIREGSKELNLSTSQTTQDDNLHGVPHLLIDHFVSMTDPSLAQNTDNEMAFHCAYSLPGVALTLGSKNWHLLKDTVETLASDMQYKVRRTVASSLHELALILGPEITTKCLTPIFEGFIKDLDEVRIGVLKHLAHFLQLMSPTARAACLPKLADFLQGDNELNWRFRQELAEQLKLAVPLFRGADATSEIAYMATVLLGDTVAAVRDTALELTTDLLKHISKKKGRTHRVLIMLAEMFAHSKMWKRRQTFTLLCSHVLKHESIALDMFATDVMPHLLDLSWDPVPNVRLVVGRTIALQMITHPFFSDPNNEYYEGLETVLRRLQADKDRDVRHSTSFLYFPSLY